VVSTDIKPEWAQILAAGIAEMGLELSEMQQEKLLRYIALLHKWSQAFNLTSIRDPMEMIPRHLLDSLAVSVYLQGERILDVGTGPGLPGIPLAILHPERSFTLLDGNSKKTRFVRQAAMELGLDNVDVVHSRAESYRPSQGFHCILTRAFAPLPDIVKLTRHLLAEDGMLLAMKGRYPEEELSGLNADSWTLEVASLKVPLLEGERHIIVIRPASG
jgi:16S rRNA (guanine527-N7)-methyltransferase